MSFLEDGGNRPLIVNLLLEEGHLKEEDLEVLPKVMVRFPSSIEEALVRSELVEDMDLARAYAGHLDIPLLEDREGLLEECRKIMHSIPASVARVRRVVPLSMEKGILVAAFQDPTDLAAQDEIEFISGCTVVAQVAPFHFLAKLMDDLYGGRDMVKEIASQEVKEPEKTPAKEEGIEAERVTDLERQAPGGKEGQVINIVNILLSSAIKEKASDIHLEPYENTIRLRYRVDGHLVEMTPPPKALFVSIISRMKVLAKMDIAERRIPQDGAISVKLSGKRVDLRVSTCPTVYGEKMVLRILDNQSTPESLTTLGFSRKQSEIFEKAARMPHGLIFVTGPTGSGKSTTLYTSLNLINRPNVNICTVEDPVEYRFEGLNQCNVRSNVGLTFSSALRSFLRQDPDVIMVGEVRDQETAQICLRSALTGHLVFSTLHTNDSLQAVNRLIDMGIEPFLLGPTLRLVQAQRLARKICRNCRAPYEVPDRVAERYGLEPGATLYRPTGEKCTQCRDTGYKGRIGVYEVIPISENIEELIMDRAPYQKLVQAAREDGACFLSDSARDHLVAGHTSLEEVSEYLEKRDEESWCPGT